jgi:hypothetical protein
VEFVALQQKNVFHRVQNVSKIVPSMKAVEYLRVFDEFLLHTNLMACNATIFVCFVNFLSFLVIIFFLANGFLSSPHSPLYAIELLSFLLTVYWREAIALLVLLHQIGLINYVGAQLPKMILKGQNWISVDTAGTSAVLCLTVLQCPLGYRIFGFRPTHRQIIVQMVTILIGLAASTVVKVVLYREI